MKKYQIKVYNIDWSYNATINENNILNEIAFTSNVNWWVGQLSIETDFKLDDIKPRYWKYVKVVLYDDYHKWWLQIYYWYISQIEKKVESSRETTTFVCLWINSLLNNILFTNGSQTKTPSWMITDVLTFFQNEYSCITAWTIPTPQIKIIIDKINLVLILSKVFRNEAEANFLLTDCESWIFSRHDQIIS